MPNKRIIVLIIISLTICFFGLHLLTYESKSNIYIEKIYNKDKNIITINTNSTNNKLYNIILKYVNDNYNKADYTHFIFKIYNDELDVLISTNDKVTSDELNDKFIDELNKNGYKYTIYDPYKIKKIIRKFASYYYIDKIVYLKN